MTPHVKPDVRKARSRQSAEIFTPPSLVADMLDKLPASVWLPGATFCDPSCGNGNFLIEILRRKIEVYHHAPLDALKTLFGCDIQADNKKECRWRLLKEISRHEAVTKEHVHVVFQQIVTPNPTSCPNGSLDYDFDFPNKTGLDGKEVKSWLDAIKKGMLDSVQLDDLGDIEEKDSGDLFA